MKQSTQRSIGMALVAAAALAVFVGSLACSTSGGGNGGVPAPGRSQGQSSEVPVLTAPRVTADLKRPEPEDGPTRSDPVRSTPAPVPAPAPKSQPRADPAPSSAPVTLLHVVDAASRAPLQGVTVRIETLLGTLLGTFPTNFSGAPFIESADSPMELSYTPGDLSGPYLRCWVGCEGYGWEKIVIDPYQPGERLVPLRRAGSLEVHVEGDWPKELIVAVTRDGKSEVLMRLEAADGKTQVLRQLPPGRYRATAQSKRPLAGAVPIASAEAAVREGSSAAITLTLPDLTEPPLVRAAGVVIVPPDWFDEIFLRSPEALFEGTHPLYSDSVKALLDGQHLGTEAWSYTFDLGEVHAGHYTVKVRPGLYTETFEIPESGQENLRIELPRLCEIRVRPVHAGTGQPAQARSISWRVAGGVARRTQVIEAPLRRDEDGSYRLNVASGSITLWCRGPAGSFSGAKNLYARPGQEFPIELIVPAQEPVEGQVTLKHKDTPVPWPYEAKLSMAHLDGRDARASSGYSYSGQNWSLIAPGSYLIDVPDILGFRHQEPIQVEVQQGVWNSITIELIPE